MAFREARVDVESQFPERHGGRSLQSKQGRPPLNLTRMGPSEASPTIWLERNVRLLPETGGARFPRPAFVTLRGLVYGAGSAARRP